MFPFVISANFPIASILHPSPLMVMIFTETFLALAYSPKLM